MIEEIEEFEENWGKFSHTLKFSPKFSRPLNFHQKISHPPKNTPTRYLDLKKTRP